MKRKLTTKQKKFIEHYTNDKNLETFGNAKQSAMKSYDTSEASAGQIGHNLLKNVEVSQAIEKKILKKEELQAKQGNLVEKLEEFVLKNGVTVENTPIIRELGVNIERNAKLNGDLIERIQSINVNIDRSKDLSSLTKEDLAIEVMKRMQEGYVGGGGE